MRRVALLVVASACGRIDFDPLTDSSSALIGNYWITDSQRGLTVSALVTHPIDGAGFGAPCPEVTTSSGNYRFLLAHPTLPYVYGVEQQLEGVALHCQSNDVTPIVTATITRTRPRASLDLATATGFYTLDGPMMIGTYEFRIAADGTPTNGGTMPVDGPLLAGPIVYDPPSGVFTAGDHDVRGYALGANQMLPGPGTIVGIPCSDTVDMFVTGAFFVVLCNDSDGIYLFDRNPAAPTARGVVFMPAIDSAAALPGDRIVAATTGSPPQLALVNLNAGAPTYSLGPPLDSHGVAVAASPDGRIIVVARLLDAMTSTLDVFTVDGDQLHAFASQTVNAAITAVAITVPG